MPTRAERFLAHLERLSGGVQPRLFPAESTHTDLPGVTVLVYDDLPEPGMITCFTYGISLASHFGGKISAESEMTGFVIFAPAVLDQSDYLGVDVGDTLPINIAGLYPVHDDERRYIQAYGLEAFWDLDRDLYDTRRAPAV